MDEAKGGRSWKLLLFGAVVCGFFTYFLWPLALEYAKAHWFNPSHEEPPVAGGKHADAKPPLPGNHAAEGAGLAGKPPPQHGNVIRPPAGQPTPPRYRDLRIDQPFDALFLAHPAWMDTPSLRLVRLSDKRWATVCVVQSAIRKDSDQGRIQAHTVCAAKAVLALAKEKVGVEVAANVVVQNDEVEEVIRTAVRGHAKAIPAVGSWVSRDGGTLFVAYARIFEADEIPKGKREVKG